MARFLVGTLAQSALFFLLIFGPTWALRGDLDWPRGAFSLAVMAAVSGLGGLWFVNTDPALARERASAPRPQSLGDGLATATIGLTAVVWFVSAAWDAHKLHLPGLPPLISLAAGLAIYFAGVGIIVWTFRTNSFAATVVKVQQDRKQRVIDTGPYALVRHPLYMGAIMFFVGLGLMLGSTMAGLLAVPLFMAAFTPRILVEEAVLSRDLTGYTGYKSRVRARIVPGLF